MAEMWSASARSKRDRKEIIAYIRVTLTAALSGDGEMHASLSEEIVEVPTSSSGDDIRTLATGTKTLTVSWTAGDPDRSGVIDEESFSQIAKEVEEEMGYSALTNAPHGEFALRVAERYIQEVEG